MIDIRTLEATIIGGSPFRRALSLTIEWAIEHREELMEDSMSIQTTPEANQAAGVIPAAPWREKAPSVLPDYRLAITFMDGTNGIADFSSVLTARECGIFEALKDKACLDQARLVLGVVTWPSGADIDPAWMYKQIKANKSWSVPFQ